MPAPKKPAHERKNYFTSLWCTEAQLKDWEACAAVEGVNLSVWIRDSLDYWVRTGYMKEVVPGYGWNGRMIKLPSRGA